MPAISWLSRQPYSTDRTIRRYAEQGYSDAVSASVQSAWEQHLTQHPQDATPERLQARLDQLEELVAYNSVSRQAPSLHHIPRTEAGRRLQTYQVQTLLDYNQVDPQPFQTPITGATP